MIKNFVVDNLNHLKRLLGCYRVDYHVPMNANEVLGIKQTVLILGNVSTKRSILKYVGGRLGMRSL